MLLCLALQILQCQCRCKADADSENTQLRSQTACAPEALGRIQSLTRIPPGLGCWVEGPWRRCLQRENVTNIVATSLRNGSKIVPKWSQHGCQMGPGGLLEASWRSLGALRKAWSAKGGLPVDYGRLLDASWSDLGAEKSCLERLLAAPRGIPRQVSAILEAKRLPKGRPKGSKIESTRRLKLKTRHLQKVSFYYVIH